jgi:hypothetical protein
VEMMDGYVEIDEDLGEALVLVEVRDVAPALWVSENGPVLVVTVGKSQIRIAVGATESLEQDLLGAQRLMTESKRFAEAIAAQLATRLQP